MDDFTENVGGLRAGLTPADAGDASGRALRVHAGLAEAARFLVRPTFMAAPMPWGRAAGKVLLTAGAVHVALLALVIAPVWLAAQSAGVLPASDIDPGAVAASPLAFLVIAPLLEELVFRSWLTGRVAALRFATCGFAALALMLAGVSLLPDHARMLGWAGAGVALAGFVQWGLTRQSAAARAVPPAVIRHFGGIVWAQALLFGLIHLGNYAALDSPLGLAVVLPQVLGGVLLAYIRTRTGLVAAIGYHAGYNGAWLIVPHALG